MQIVIDIPDHEIPKKQDIISVDIHFIDGEVCECDYGFQVLPKGHGDLKDTEKLKNAFIAWSMAVHGNFTDADIASIIYNSPTIIEADKESENNRCM